MVVISGACLTEAAAFLLMMFTVRRFACALPAARPWHQQKTGGIVATPLSLCAAYVFAVFACLAHRVGLRMRF